MKLPENLNQKLENRKHNNSLRKLPVFNNLVDFSSNDYIGFSKSESIFKLAHAYLHENEIFQNGATGSRLISGNHSLYHIAENFIAQFHDAEAALIFNSGYDANLGFFSAVPQRNDVILYDELSHASIRDGIIMSNSKSYKFNHNDFEDLERLILKFPDTNIYIVTETVFSMDGDSPNLEELVQLSEKYNCYLVVDEAHTLGVFGDKGEGLLQYLELHNRIFARIMTFGKGLGCHGAVVLGSPELKEYLINFARSFIYTTGLSPHSVATILTAYQQLEIEKEVIEKLRQNIIFFNQQKNLLGLKPMFVRSKSAIQSAIVQGNESVKKLAQQLQDKGFDVKPILSPTVPEGQERLRFCIHSYNSEEEIRQILELLGNYVY
ncbi:pyridoxal phosphate-dependent aminotransferase family protein [Flavobacterium sp. WLB]|uniref:aminotransferase class I/II-fold pyridoxal phosphate-dependent enzyme n=1 Tax=unclassified Flavobacterium TaxID=196869 RepID=UPI0006ABDEA7|nr:MULTISPECIES: pyridoxal phosphate-dependent aminotransferase family protein [unclassified Flavobacterium]KOP36207.1 8-amino-7-oxononanoate synthase [Flavobacterium sp. VMW]OWU88668.1 8-amino-7-oxononanoate synthase [Flavobacterium sp. NLM]PUU69982.1 pyridoxal phosphate-dependent aminotransferase family protein [Flavobacterium sp. WLB]